MLKETFLQNMRNIEGIKIVVTREYPRGYSKEDFDFFWSDLSPSVTLSNNWTNRTLTEEEFTESFRDEILKNIEALKKIQLILKMQRPQRGFVDVRREIPERVVYLISSEVEGVFSHRRILLELIQNIRYCFPPEPLCSNFIVNSIEGQCLLKVRKSLYINVPKARGKRGKETMYYKRTIGHPRSCDIFDQMMRQPRGELLSNCVLLQDRGLFTCETCIFANEPDCLKHSGQKLFLNKCCVDYVEKKLRLGNLSLIVRTNLLMMTKGISVSELRKIWKKSVGQSKETQEQEPELVQEI